MKYFLLALMIAFLPTQALAGISCRGDSNRGSYTYLSYPIGRAEPNGSDSDLDPGTYTLDKICLENGNLALVYMEQDETGDFYYLTLTQELRAFIESLERN